MTSFHELKHSLSEALTRLLWDQWVSIGLAGATRFRPVPFVVDPEALLLATSRFGLDDSRLFGEVLDWLAVNGKLLCAQKLKSMCARSELADTEVLGAMNGYLAEHTPGLAPKLLSFSSATAPLPGLSQWFGESAFELRRQSQRPNPAAPEAFLFKMRSFFGINARAEAFTWLLLADRSGHPARIARETGWVAKTVQVVLNEMSESGLILVSPGEREKQFRINKEDWDFLLPKNHRPVWWCQSPFYEACHELIKLLNELEKDPGASDASKAVKIRRFQPRLSNAFVLAKHPGRFESISELRGTDLVEAVVKETLRLIEGIEDRHELLKTGDR